MPVSDDPVLSLEEIDQALETQRYTARDWARPQGAALLATWSASGATVAQIASRIGVTVSTLRRWRATHVEIARALDEADDLATTKVEAALYRRALGFDTEETTTTITEGPLGTTEQTKVVVRHVAPDVKAATFWLKNRAPDRWSDRTEVEHTINIMEEQATELMRVMDKLGVDAEKAIEEIKAVDRSRKNYHNYYCETKWGDARGYDMTVKSDVLGCEETAKMLIAYIRSFMEQE